MRKPIIYTKDVEITYNEGKSNEFKALKGVNVEIFPREYIILFGPSGCGKSTLLYSMFGVLPPSRGKMYVKGDSIYDFEPMQMVHFQRKTMGIMYQQFNLINSISVLDNVALPLVFAGVPAHRRIARAQELLKRFGIDHVADKVPTNLSGGQQQRVSVARSLVNDPEILIADEPVGNLDSISAEQVMDTLEQINLRDKKTVLLVTHDAKYLPYAHRILYMKDGFVDRMVVNPEKEQIIKVKPGETIVTEIEQIARLFPYASPQELRVKSVVNYLTQGMSFDQITQLEKYVETMIEGRMAPGVFFELLLRDQKEKGIGLNEQEASVLATKMKKILEQSLDVRRIRKRKENPNALVHSEGTVEEIRNYLLEERQLTDLSEAQKETLDGIIRNRVTGIIRKEEFKAQIALPLDQRGVGLDKRNAHDLSRYFEKLIAQGVGASLIKEGHH
jgi:putative ABC transport system ATP-binding protein